MAYQNILDLSLIKKKNNLCKISLEIKVRLQHILDAIVEIKSYILGSKFEDFTNNSMMRFACLKQIEIIGEASHFITEETKAKFSDIE